MGHASSVALGIALEKPERHVVALDGDSAAIMHMGAMTMASKENAPNFMHVILNNGAHESVGGQPSAGHLINFTGIADACGYATVGHAATTENELIEAIQFLKGSKVMRALLEAIDSYGLYLHRVTQTTHVKFVNALMAVTKEEYDDARQILGTGDGVVKGSGGNKMNEIKPHTNWAKKIYNRARAFGVIENESGYVKLFAVNDH